MGSQKQLGTETRPRHPSVDSISRHRTPQTQLTSTSISFINTDDTEEESKC
jgi:hypothetical protein